MKIQTEKGITTTDRGDALYTANFRSPESFSERYDDGLVFVDLRAYMSQSARETEAIEVITAPKAGVTRWGIKTREERPFLDIGSDGQTLTETEVATVMQQVEAMLDFNGNRFRWDGRERATLPGAYGQLGAAS